MNKQHNGIISNCYATVLTFHRYAPKLILGILLLMHICTVKLYAQTTSPIKIWGTITDARGDALPGVSVTVKNTRIVVVTNKEGQYVIRVPDSKSILVFSFMGMKTREFPVIGKTTIDVSMEDNATALNEVIAIGYGTVKKSDLTGSVSKLVAKNVSDSPINSLEQLVQGRVSGVQVTTSSGAPGAGISFLVRGSNSTSNNAPLIVLDGYPIDPGAGGTSIGGDGTAVVGQPTINPLTSINPNDIESVEILKDASSTAIYGSRGANGVVIITTKRGKAGADRVQLSYRTDVSQVAKTLPVLNTTDFVAYLKEAAANSGTPVPTIYTGETNWQDQIFKNGVSRDYQASVLGGDAKTKYAITGNYDDVEGIVKNTSYKRGGIKFNLDRDFSKRFKVGVNINASKTKSLLGLNSSTTGSIAANVISSALLFAPFRIPFTNVGDVDQTLESNPVTQVELMRDQYESDLVFGNVTGKLKLTDDLSVNLNVGANTSDGLRQAYQPRGTQIGNSRKGYAYRGQTNNFNYLTEFTLNYNKKWRTSTLDAVGGYSWQQYNTNTMGTSTADFPNDNLTFYSFQSGNAPGVTSTSYQESALASFFGRLNYSYQGKYLFTFTGRADGSTRLAEGNKWAFFPSGAIGWNVHMEDFMKDVKAISRLKLRASYGLSGNQSVGIGSTTGTLTSGLNSTTVIGSGIVKGYVLNNIANPQLGWETTTQTNIGFDLGLLQDRFSLEVNVYNKITKDLLVPLPIPTTTGFKTYTSNTGEVRNRGIEFDLGAKILTGKLKWDASGNASINRNKVLNLGALGDNGKIFGPNYLNANGILDQPIHVAQVGSSIGSFYGYRINGIYQNAAEVAAGPEATTAKPGDFKFVDISGPKGVPDGQITADDRVIIGNPYPTVIFGLTNSFTYKDISLSFFFQANLGNQIANLNRYRMDALNAKDLYNVNQVAYDNRWTGEGTSNKYPRATALGNYFNSRFSDFVVEDGSYVRLKNVNVSYRLPLKKVRWVNSVRVFATATNLLTFTKYTGFDPEVSANYNNALTPGVDNGTYPQTRTLSFGINFDL